MDIDYEIALRLQKEFDDERSFRIESKPIAEEQESDLDLAARLQAEYDAEINDDSEDCTIISSNLPPTNKAVQKEVQKYEDSDYALALQLQNDWEPVEKTKSKSSEDSDLALALKLQNQFQAEDKKATISSIEKETPHKGNHNIVDASWELVDPCPNIYALFAEFNTAYFWSKLEGVEVRWSPRMTLCAGLCVYEGRGGLCSVRISKPLLKLRPRKDMVETLLHEMIHAYLFVTQNNKDHDGHGPEFHKHMYRINELTGTNITVYHSFHQEVALYKQHWWRCTGACRDRKPFCGWVKRSMNRAPSANDLWWAEHQRTCSGTFVKVKSPEPDTSHKGVKRKATDSTGAVAKVPPGMKDIRTIFSPSASASKSNGNPSGAPLHKKASPTLAKDPSKNKTKPQSNKDIRSLFPPSSTQSSDSSSPGENKENPPPNFQNRKERKSATETKNIRTLSSLPVREDTKRSSDNKSQPFPGKGHVLGKF